MLNTISKMVLGVCTLGLCACGLDAAPPEQNPQDKKTTLKLTRLEDGNLEYCNAAGECKTLPYDGACAVIEVDINEATGNTCERCITAEGEAIDQGCKDTSIGCVLVTLPDPDCVVCAYVEGEVIFSTCEVTDTDPVCRTDADCQDNDGQSGFCVEGQCHYQPGCGDDGDCPPGFMCVYAASGDWGDYGSCVPRQVGCWDDGDCPSDMYCESFCGDAVREVECATDADCFDGSRCYDGLCGGGGDSPMPACDGICMPRFEDPCQNFRCDQGAHCEVICWDVAAADDIEARCDEGEDCGGCQPVCVSDPEICYGDEDCEPGFTCEMLCYEGEPVDCTDGAGRFAADCMAPYPCEGVCVPQYVDPCEDVDCADGQHCELSCDWSNCAEGDYCGDCYPLCVDDPEICYSDEDCEPDFTCEMWCYEGEPVDCTDGEGRSAADCMAPSPCEGVCVPRYVDPCDDVRCQQGEHCEAYCFYGTCAAGEYCGEQCVAECIPDDQFCWSDDDCIEGQVCEIYELPCDDSADPGCGSFMAPRGYCVDLNEPTYCYSDEDCGEGRTCDLYATILPCAPDESGCGGLVAPGICVDERPEPTCGDDFPEGYCPEGSRCEYGCDAPEGADCAPFFRCVAEW